MKYDLCIRDGDVLLDSGELVKADIAVSGGRISAIAAAIDDAEVTVDAAGCIVAPGIVDPHVHFGNAMPFLDELEHDSRAALLGGVTSIGCFLRSTKPYSPDLPALVDGVDSRSAIDVFFHLQIFNDEQIGDISISAQGFGIDSFKFYLSGIPGIVGQVDEATLLRGMRAAKVASSSAVVAVHCENQSLIESARSEPAPDSESELRAWEHRHPAIAEVVAIETSAALADAADVRLYVVHISSAGGLQHVRRLQAAGADVIGETTSAYLSADWDDPNGLLVKQAPPVRSPGNRRALWAGVVDGTINTIGTDNTARTLASKNPEGGVDGSKPGLPMLGIHAATLLHYGVAEGNTDLATLWRCVSRRPAEVFGLYPQKGSLSIGADADIVVIDPSEKRTVVAADVGSFADFSPMQGKTLTGWPRTTVKSGVVAAQDGRVIEKNLGRYLPRALCRRSP